MRKVLLAAMLLLSYPIVFVSCSKSDSEASSQDMEQNMSNYLVGRWKLASVSERGGVYNTKYRLEGDFFITFSKNGNAECSGDAKMHYYYEGESEFLTNNVSDFIHFEEWIVDYNDVTGYDLRTKITHNAISGTIFGLEKNGEGTITLSKLGVSSYTYYTFKKV